MEKTKRKKGDISSALMEDSNDFQKIVKSSINRRCHILLLATNLEGLRKLFKLVSTTYSEEYFYRYPRMDYELIKSFVNEMTSRVSELRLRPDIEQELHEELSMIQAQIDSPRPNSKIVVDSFVSISRILGTSGQEIAEKFLSQLEPIIVRSKS